MPLTPAQLVTLGAHIDANGATAPGTTGAISALPRTADNADAVARWYNLDAAGPYRVWNPATPVAMIRAALDISKYTPTDSPPASTNNVTGTNDALLFNNRCLACQLKQANAFFFVQGAGVVDATPAALRQSFNDCMTAIPSGVGGAASNAGWGTPAAPGAVRLAMQRSATNAEKVFSVQASGAGAAGNVSGDARGGTTNPDALVFVGAVSADEIRQIWGI